LIDTLPVDVDSFSSQVTPQDGGVNAELHYGDQEKWVL
jgi:hypothetical protein